MCARHVPTSRILARSAKNERRREREREREKAEKVTESRNRIERRRRRVVRRSLARGETFKASCSGLL